MKLSKSISGMTAKRYKFWFFSARKSNAPGETASHRCDMVSAWPWLQAVTSRGSPVVTIGFVRCLVEDGQDGAGANLNQDWTLWPSQIPPPNCFVVVNFRCFSSRLSQNGASNFHFWRFILPMFLLVFHGNPLHVFGGWNEVLPLEAADSALALIH